MAGQNKAGRKPPPGTTNAKGAQGGGEEEEEEEEAEEYVTPAQLNAAITKGLRRFASKQLPELLKGSLASALAEAGFKKPGEGEEEEEEEAEEGAQGAQGAAQGAKQGKAAQTPAQAPTGPQKPSKAERDLAKLRKEMEEMQAARKQEAEKAQRLQDRNALTEQLTTAGVRKEMTGPLITWLLSDESGRLVRRTDEGKLVFAMGADAGDEVDELPLKEGLTAWFKSDTGKTYLAPRQAGGSGFQGAPPRGAPPARGAQGAANARDAAEQELFNALQSSLGANIELT